MAYNKDYPEVEKLWLQLNSLHVVLEPSFIQTVEVFMTDMEFNNILQDVKQEILVVEDSAHIVGAAWIIERAHSGGQAIDVPVVFIKEICVSENERSLGYGKALMDNIQTWARKRKLERIEFNVWSKNKDALTFYKNLGFTFTRHEMNKSIV
ncbi:MAG: ribosomal protein S18 acetylase RimI-like enzyme [Flavobacterium sp.]|jgi:ribosomal protein S18 acetylase RimI-like enzyme